MCDFLAEKKIVERYGKGKPSGLSPAEFLTELVRLEKNMGREAFSRTFFLTRIRNPMLPSPENIVTVSALLDTWEVYDILHCAMQNLRHVHGLDMRAQVLHDISAAFRRTEHPVEFVGKIIDREAEFSGRNEKGCPECFAKLSGIEKNILASSIESLILTGDETFLSPEIASYASMFLGDSFLDNLMFSKLKGKKGTPVVLRILASGWDATHLEEIDGAMRTAAYYALDSGDVPQARGIVDAIVRKLKTGECGFTLMCTLRKDLNDLLSQRIAYKKTAKQTAMLANAIDELYRVSNNRTLSHVPSEDFLSGLDPEQM